MNAFRLMKKYGIRPSKKLGQNFLVNEKTVSKIIDSAQIRKDETVLEIGPGLGSITNELLKKAGKVIAVEKDTRIIHVLEREFEKEISGGKLEIIQGDFLKIEIPGFDKCVANIPYSISAKTTIRLGELEKPSILMYQKEFAERLVQNPGAKKYSRISIVSQYYFDTEILFNIPKTHLCPSPDVNSSVVKLTPKKEKIKLRNKKVFFNILTSLFSHKKQSVRKAFLHSRREYKLTKKEAVELAENIPSKDEKVKNLTPKEIKEIADYLENKIKN